MSQLKQNNLEPNPRSLIQDISEEQTSQITGGGMLTLKISVYYAYLAEFEAELAPYNQAEGKIRGTLLGF
jgi:hypothetical protein